MEAALFLLSRPRLSTFREGVYVPAMREAAHRLSDSSKPEVPALPSRLGDRLVDDLANSVRHVPGDFVAVDEERGG